MSHAAGVASGLLLGRSSSRVMTGPAGVRVTEPFRTAKVKPRSIRRSYEIHGYTGANGSGKSLCAAFDSLPTLAAGRPVVSTMRFLDPATGKPHPLWIPLDDFRTLLEVEFCDVIMDEVTGVASARDTGGVPPAVLNHLQQLRRRDVSLRWTTPHWAWAETGIRRVTKAVTTGIGLVPEPAPQSEDGMDRLWRSRRLMIWRTYDAKDFDEWSKSRERSSQKSYRQKPVARQVFWRPGSIASAAYDTFDDVLSLGAVSDAGLCMECGGKRPAKRCSCGSDHLVQHEHELTAGQRAWREYASARRLLAGTGTATTLDTIEFPETDDTPAVMVEVSA